MKKDIQLLQAKTDANTKQESNLCKQTDATQIVQVMFPSQMLFQVLHTQL